MDIQQVNAVLSKAIMFFQEKEIEAIIEDAIAKGITSYAVPTPRKFGAIKGPKQSRLLKKGEAVEGMILGDWRVIKASPSRVTIMYIGSRSGKSFTHTWDGIGYSMQSGYLYTDGARPLEGEKPDPNKKYPVGTTISGGKYVLVITGPPKDVGRGTLRHTTYQGRKAKGKKKFEINIYSDGDVVFRDGKKRESLHEPVVLFV